MQCYDCAVDGRTTTAVSVCSTCGSGLCLDHAVLGHADEWTTSVGNPSVARLPGRRILCQACSSAASREEATAPVAGIVNAPDI